MPPNWTAEDLAAHMARLLTGDSRKPIGIEPNVTGPAKGRLPVPKGLNKTEQAYADHLQQFYLARNILWWGFEAMTFKLAHDTRYTPDFIVLMADATIRCVDTKGARLNRSTGTTTYYAEEDSKIKIKVAAKLFPFFRWSYVFKNKAGEWQEVVFG